MSVDSDDQPRLEDQIKKIEDQYQKENDAIEKIVDWERVYRDQPTTL
jgi:hypothetical protein